mmetsp:Transcript_33958/g.101363  ORF Transcript_33958/g.101363 Transcript_33958/m.101363 type:complete len:80 (-) Transcript_33958:451-690(-)
MAEEGFLAIIAVLGWDDSYEAEPVGGEEICPLWDIWSERNGRTRVERIEVTLARKCRSFVFPRMKEDKSDSQVCVGSAA